MHREALVEVRRARALGRDVHLEISARNTADKECAPESAPTTGRRERGERKGTHRQVAPPCSNGTRFSPTYHTLSSPGSDARRGCMPSSTVQPPISAMRTTFSICERRRQGVSARLQARRRPPQEAREVQEQARRRTVSSSSLSTDTVPVSTLVSPSLHLRRAPRSCADPTWPTLVLVGASSRCETRTGGRPSLRCRSRWAKARLAMREPAGAARTSWKGTGSAA